MTSTVERDRKHSILAAESVAEKLAAALALGPGEERDDDNTTKERPSSRESSPASPAPMEGDVEEESSPSSDSSGGDMYFPYGEGGRKLSAEISAERARLRSGSGSNQVLHSFQGFFKRTTERSLSPIEVEGTVAAAVAPCPPPPFPPPPPPPETCNCYSLEVEVLAGSQGLELEARYSHNRRVVSVTWTDGSLAGVANIRAGLQSLSWTRSKRRRNSSARSNLGNRRDVETAGGGGGEVADAAAARAKKRGLVSYEVELNSRGSRAATETGGGLIVVKSIPKTWRCAVIVKAGFVKKHNTRGSAAAGSSGGPAEAGQENTYSMERSGSGGVHRRGSSLSRATRSSVDPKQQRRERNGGSSRQGAIPEEEHGITGTDCLRPGFILTSVRGREVTNVPLLEAMDLLAEALDETRYQEPCRLTFACHTCCGRVPSETDGNGEEGEEGEEEDDESADPTQRGKAAKRIVLPLGEGCCCAEGIEHCSIFPLYAQRAAIPYLGLAPTHTKLFDRTGFWESMMDAVARQQPHTGRDSDFKAMARLATVEWSSRPGGSGPIQELALSPEEAANGAALASGSGRVTARQPARVSSSSTACSSLVYLLPATRQQKMRGKYAAFKGVRIEPSSTLLERDVKRTLGCRVVVGQDHHASLYRVANTALIDAGLQYAQGITYIAAIVLMQEPDEPSACAILTQIIEQPLFKAILPRRGMDNKQQWGSRRPNEAGASASPPSGGQKGASVLHLLLETLEGCVRVHLPLLHIHLEDQQVPLSYFATEWFMCLFCKATSLPLAAAVIDASLVLEDAPLRVALALLEVLEPVMLKMDRTSLLKRGNRLAGYAASEEVMTAMLAIRLPTCGMSFPTAQGQLNHILGMLRQRQGTGRGSGRGTSSGEEDGQCIVI